jgi:ribosome-associated heat shock protein Hsp15
LDRQRIDKWLWHARVVRTRTAAAALAASGHVRVNGQRIDGASRAVRLGDVVTVALDRTVRVLKVAAFAERRGPAESARVLVEDLLPLVEQGPSPPVAAPAGLRQAGAGRPTKRDRRAIAHFRGEDEF